MKRVLPLFALALLAGCVAETVIKRKPRKGPVAEVGWVDYGGGEVRYLTEGWGWFVSGRRRHARRLMRKNCGKKLEAQVTDEFGRQDADVPYSGDDIAQNLGHGGEHFKIQNFQHIVYDCRPHGSEPGPAKAPAPVPAPVPAPAPAPVPAAVEPSTAAPSVEPSTAPASAPEPAPVQNPEVPR